MLNDHWSFLSFLDQYDEAAQKNIVRNAFEELYVQKQIVEGKLILSFPLSLSLSFSLSFSLSLPLFLSLF